MGETSFCPAEFNFDDILLGCQPYHNGKTTFLRVGFNVHRVELYIYCQVRGEEAEGKTIFQILPYLMIENCLPEAVDLRFSEVINKV